MREREREFDRDGKGRGSMGGIENIRGERESEKEIERERKWKGGRERWEKERLPDMRERGRDRGGVTRYLRDSLRDRERQRERGY